MDSGFTQRKIGILGGGQLGKMLIQAGSRLDLNLAVLDGINSPSKAICEKYHVGDFKSEEDVTRFGNHCDIITIEIEQVNTSGLKQLYKQGKACYPDPNTLELIADKGLQKEFYAKHQLPTTRFQLLSDRKDVIYLLEQGLIGFPFVQKTRTDGYDGKGVQIIKSSSDFDLLFDCPCVIEEKIDLQKEIAVQIVRSITGEIKVYPTVEMVFHPTANLLEYQMYPASIPEHIERRAQQLAIKVAEAFQIIGILSVEMFLDKQDKLLINEVAPRVHNSGHHTLDNGATSQFENHLRAILGLPLGSTHGMPALMLNILGSPGYSGAVIYEGLEACMRLEGVHVHLYGKLETRPYRKMGHITIVGNDMDALKQKAQFILQTLKVIA